MKFSNEFKRKLNTIFLIALSWTLISVIQLLYEITIIFEYGNDYRWSTTNNFATYLLINTSAFAVNGFIGGLVIVRLRDYIRNQSYTFGLIYGVIIYIILFFLMTGLQNYFVIQSIWDGSIPFHVAYLKGLEDYFFSYEFIRLFPFWLFILTGTLIILFINDKYGPGELKKFLAGRYFYPKSEKRIFMFLDLKGSTSIAEQLGERKYFSFIQKVFKDITPTFLEHKGEVYQYVGDEIVITWKKKNGVKEMNCIRCFQNIRKLLIQLAPSYRELYGVAPEFKAGLHVGTAIVGEVGVIKRDIAYSGDVINTTARIQSMCNKFEASLLVSKQVLELFDIKNLNVVSLGKVQLRGKVNAINLYSIQFDSN